MVVAVYEWKHYTSPCYEHTLTLHILFQYAKDVSNWYLSLQQTGHTALMLAAKTGHLNVVKKLITTGASLDSTNKVNSLSTTDIHCTQLHAQHVTMLCSLSAVCVVTVSSQFPILDLYLSFTWETSPDSKKLSSTCYIHLVIVTSHDCKI